MWKKDKTSKNGTSSSRTQDQQEEEQTTSPTQPAARPLAPAPPREPSSPADGGQTFDPRFFSSNALAAQQAYQKAAAVAGVKTNSNAGYNEAYDSSYAMQARAQATATASRGNTQPEAQQPPTAPYAVQSEANQQQPSRPSYSLPPPTRPDAQSGLYATTDPRAYQNLSVAGNFPGYGRAGAPSSSQFGNDELYDLSDEEREAHRRRRQREREREGR
ncbi:hypothetical protein PRZ48_008849 [Zasmidium cellare]|uniref:Uncharacterized protein n=1 Tax=Zasmidium cellare TaxID=395010 RepID=A0ABR0EGP7_ZASCE|nr:hypothetical protein PRZ48_008849 [Zasmidium cellare]